MITQKRDLNGEFEAVVRRATPYLIYLEGASLQTLAGHLRGLEHLRQVNNPAGFAQKLSEVNEFIDTYRFGDDRVERDMSHTEDFLKGHDETIRDIKHRLTDMEEIVRLMRPGGKRGRRKQLADEQLTMDDQDNELSEDQVETGGDDAFSDLINTNNSNLRMFERVFYFMLAKNVPMEISEIADQIGITSAQVTNTFKDIRKRNTGYTVIYRSNPEDPHGPRLYSLVMKETESKK